LTEEITLALPPSPASVEPGDLASSPRIDVALRDAEAPQDIALDIRKKIA